MPNINIFSNVSTNNPLVRDQKLNSSLTLTNAKDTRVVVIPSPVNEDYGFEGSFIVPNDYVGTPKIVIKSILDGTPIGTIAFAYSDNAVAANESVDAAYGTEKTVANAAWTNYLDKDLFSASITLTAGDYAVGDQVFYKFVRDASAELAAADSFAGRVLLTSLHFDYANL